MIFARLELNFGRAKEEEDEEAEVCTVHAADLGISVRSEICDLSTPLTDIPLA